jgi:hypothetical protein
MPDDKIHILPDAHPAGFIFEAVCTWIGFDLATPQGHASVLTSNS